MHINIRLPISEPFRTLTVSGKQQRLQSVRMSSSPEPNANVMFPPRNQGYWTGLSNHSVQQVKAIYENLKQGLSRQEQLSGKG
jgi:hypothetical protein